MNGWKDTLRRLPAALARPFLRPLKARLEDDLRESLRKDLEGGLRTISVAAEYIAYNQVPGDYLEFGVHEGKSFIQAYHDLVRARKRLPPSLPYVREAIRFFAFDSFYGLPRATGLDQNDYTPQHWLVNGHRNLEGNEKIFLDNAIISGVDPSRVVVIKGLFDQTLNSRLKENNRMRQACLVHVDCDFYESARPVLSFVSDLLVDGAVIVFDDWFRYRNDPDLGEQRACREWLASRPELRLTELARHRSHSIAFIVNIRKGGSVGHE